MKNTYKQHLFAINDINLAATAPFCCEDTIYRHNMQKSALLRHDDATSLIREHCIVMMQKLQKVQRACAARE